MHSKTPNFSHLNSPMISCNRYLLAPSLCGFNIQSLKYSNLLLPEDRVYLLLSKFASCLRCNMFLVLLPGTMVSSISDNENLGLVFGHPFIFYFYATRSRSVDYIYDYDMERTLWEVWQREWKSKNMADNGQSRRQTLCNFLVPSTSSFGNNIIVPEIATTSFKLEASWINMIQSLL